jgi:CheY-like chemotaxis protein
MPTVLCIDDDPAILLLRKDHLEGSGYTVLQAETGPHGLALFASHPVHCVVVDYNMPGMNGDRVARETKRLRPEVPVLFVTGASVPEDVLQWVDGFLSRDSLPSELLQRVESLLLGQASHRGDRAQTSCLV